MKSLLRWTVIAVTSYLQLSAQTKIDLRTQAKSVDFSNADATKPAKTGTVLPAVCSAGELFISLAAPAGANTYVCTGTNTWVQQNGGLPALSLDSGSVLSITSGNTLDWMPFGGDVIGSANDMRITGIRGRRISGVAPSNGQALIWNDSTQEWEPQQPAGGGSGVLCASQSLNGLAYACFTDALSSYTTGTVVYWIAGLAGVGGATTLDINGLGAKAIKQADGLTNPSATDIVQGRMYPIWYDGLVFRFTTSSAAPGRPRTVDYAAAKCQSGEAASGFSTEAASAPSAKCVGSGNQPVYGVLEFADTGTASVQDHFFVPAGNPQTASVDIWWRTPATTGGATWQVQTSCSAGLGESTWGTPQAVVSTAAGVANTWKVATLTIDASACSGKHLSWRIMRDPAHPSDTITNAADVGRVMFSIQ